ncbi:hypothetical protein V8F06_004783 [Rhypophila decipiens]
MSVTQLCSKTNLCAKLPLILVFEISIAQICWSCRVRFPSVTDGKTVPGVRCFHHVGSFRGCPLEFVPAPTLGETWVNLWALIRVLTDPTIKGRDNDCKNKMECNMTTAFGSVNCYHQTGDAVKDLSKLPTFHTDDLPMFAWVRERAQHINPQGFDTNSCNVLIPTSKATLQEVKDKLQEVKDKLQESRNWRHAPVVDHAVPSTTTTTPCRARDTILITFKGLKAEDFPSG